MPKVSEHRVSQALQAQTSPKKRALAAMEEVDVDELIDMVSPRPVKTKHVKRVDNASVTRKKKRSTKKEEVEEEEDSHIEGTVQVILSPERESRKDFVPSKSVAKKDGKETESSKADRLSTVKMKC